MKFDGLNPTIRIFSNSNELSLDVLRVVQSVEVDQARDIPDQISLRVINPIIDKLGVGYTDGKFAFLDSKAFQPGNRIDVHIGYAGVTAHVGSGIIQRWLPSFPQEGTPTLEVKALDGSCLMMDGESAAIARTFNTGDLGVIVTDILSSYDIIPAQVDPFAISDGEVLKKQGMTDYQFVKGLANLASFEFKVRWDTTKNKWAAYWRAPVSDQTKKLTFTYLRPTATLLSFQPEWGLRDAPSEVKVLYFDPVSRTFLESTSKKKPDKTGDDTMFGGGEDDVKDEIRDLSKIRIAAGGIAVEVVPEMAFPNFEAAEAFAISWMARRRDLFLTGRGICVGYETIRPGDEHRIEGVGTQLTGDWEFTSVRHIVDADRGYMINFFANKTIL